MELKPGETFDRYVVDAVLGKGGMAVVYRVRHAQLGSFHALKILTISSASIRDRLLQEGRVQASLRHPHIVAVTDVLDIHGAPGLVMEYIEGPSLDRWMDEQKPNLAQALAMFSGIVSGVAAAHERGLVHRDLKPANVLLAPAGGGVFVPKVADFGLAKALADAEDGGMRRTRSGVTMGTPQYMAPEQIRDAKNVDRRADVFSLGCILFELACGRPPFDGPDILSIFNAVASASYPSPHSLVPDLPRPVQAAIVGCLIVDREKRIPDCAALLQVLAGASIEAVLPIARGSASEAPKTPMPTFGGQTYLSEEVPATPMAAQSAVPSQPAPVSRPPVASPPEGSLAPRSLASDPSITAPGRGRKVAGVAAGMGVLAAGAGAVVLALAVIGGGGVWWMKSSQERAVGRALDGVGATHGAVSARWGYSTVDDVVWNGPDGHPVLTIDHLTVRGGAPGDGKLDAIELAGVHADLRETADHAGWMMPAAGPSAGFDVTKLTTGPVDVVMHADDGELRATWSELELTGAHLGGAWAVPAWKLDGLDVRGTDPLLAARSVALRDGALVVDTPDAWVRLRTDGFVDAGPVLVDALPDWVGGDALADAPWLGLSGAWVPGSPTHLEATGGTLHLVDRAHAVRTVEWEWTLDRFAIGTVGAERSVPVSLDAHSGEGRVAFDGDVREDGLVRGEVEMRALPLAGFEAYIRPSLDRWAVRPTAGTVTGSVDLSAKQGSFAIAVDGDVAGAELSPEAGKVVPRASKLAGTRDVDVAVERIGSLADDSPVDAVIHAYGDALFQPVGGATWTRRVNEEPPRAHRRRDAEPALVAPPPDAPPPDATPLDAPVAVENPPATDAKPEEPAEEPLAEIVIPPIPTPDPKDPKDPLNLVNHEVREALDDFKIHRRK